VINSSTLLQSNQLAVLDGEDVVGFGQGIGVQCASNRRVEVDAAIVEPQPAQSIHVQVIGEWVVQECHRVAEAGTKPAGPQRLDQVPRFEAQ